jgi:hypothetical protein
MKLLTEQTEKNYENPFNSSVEEAWIKEKGSSLLLRKGVKSTLDPKQLKLISLTLIFNCVSDFIHFSSLFIIKIGFIIAFL